MQELYFNLKENLGVKLKSVVLIFVLSIQFLYAESVEEVKFIQITKEDGLSHRNVQAVCRDKKGFMWFGTEDGLNRWDGYECRVYRHDSDDSTSLTNNYIRNIYQDKKGRLWICTIGGGLNLYNRGSDNFKRFVFDFQNEESAVGIFNRVYCITEDHRGRMWAGFDTQGIVCFSAEDGKAVQYKTEDEDWPNCLSYNDVWDVCEDTNHDIWIGTLGGGVDRYSPEAEIFTHYDHVSEDPYSLSNDYIRCVYEDQYANIWIGTQGGGLNRYDPEIDGFIRYQYNPDNSGSIGGNVIFAISEDTDGKLWIGTETNGLSLYNRKTDSFTIFNYDELSSGSISDNSVESIFVDDKGTLWVGTYNGGVNYYNHLTQKFSLYKRTINPKSISGNKILCFHEDRNGKIWIGTDGAGFNRFDPETGVFLHYQHDPSISFSLNNDVVLSIFEDSQRQLWIGTYTGGLNLFDRETGRFIHFKHGPDNDSSISNDDVRVIFEDSKNNLWIGTLRGLNRFDREKRIFHRYFCEEEDESTIGNDAVVDIFEDSKKNLWIGTYGGGLNQYVRNEDRFIRYMHSDNNSRSISNDYVFTVFEDSYNRFWVGTADGLNLFDRETGIFDHYYIKDGLPSDFICSIQEDESGCLWLSTHNGISQLNPWKEIFHNFSKSDGLQSNEFHYGTGMKSRDGEIYFGGGNGFNRFKPSEIRKNYNIPLMVFTDIKIDNKTVTLGNQKGHLNKAVPEAEEIRIFPENAMLTIKFAALNFILPENNQYIYKLEGFNEEWMHCGCNRTVTYTNLDADSYTFRVKGSNNDGVWNEEGISLQVIVIPSFWETIWFKIIFSIVILLFIYGMYLIRTLSIRHKNEELKQMNIDLNNHVKELEKAEKIIKHSLKEKELLLQEVHHRVKNNLQVISSLLNLQARRIKNKKVKEAFMQGQDRIKSMALIHEKLYKSKNFDGVNFKEYLESLMRQLFMAYNPCGGKIKLDVEADEKALQIISAVPLGLVTNELISNAMKHAFPDTWEGEAEIKVIFKKMGENGVELTVKDNGVGMPKGFDPLKTESLGWKMISLLVNNQLEGKLTYGSENGVWVKLEIPFKSIIEWSHK